VEAVAPKAVADRRGAPVKKAAAVEPDDEEKKKGRSMWLVS
jgi:hypothetical protein